MLLRLPWAPVMQGGWFSSVPLAQEQRQLLAWATLLAIAAHSPQAPVWALAIAACATISAVLLPIRARTFWEQKQKQVQRIKLVVVLCCLAGVLIQFGDIIGRDPGSALLLCLSGLKLLECRRVRDLYVGVYLGYMLCLTALFFNQSVLLLLYVGVVVVAITGVLWHYNSQQPGLSWRALLRPMAGLFLPAAPVMILLFILFPRVSGPLWGLPDTARSGLTGISDTMEPGSISQLVQSDAVAFRVEFSGEPPEQRHLYWRGPVMVHTDGRKWSADKGRYQRHFLPEVEGERFDYILTQEPSDLHWVYALEMPDALPDATYLSSNHELKSWQAIRVRKRYQLAAHASYRMSDSSRQLQRALQLPEEAHPRARQLAARWLQEDDESVALVQRALDYFRTRGFSYTLTPGVLRGDPIDNLLFEARRGFCGHYAAAFVVLMRAAGVPARIVTGYQGGELNPVANYLTIHQFHAHAWSEVYLDQADSWVRVDPTAVVAPDRLTVNTGIAVPEIGALFTPPFSNHPWASRLWQRARNNLRALNYRWTQWVLSYGSDQQFSLLSHFGLKNTDTIIMGLITLCSLLFTMALWAASTILHYRRAEDPVQRAYGIFCARLARLGVHRDRSEAPGTFAHRLLALQARGWRWGFDGAITVITGAYVAARYGSQNEQLARLEEAVARFKPARPGRKWPRQGKKNRAP